jgi:hypothetical protein
VATIAEGVALLPSGGGIVSLLAGTYTGEGNADVTLSNGNYLISYDLLRLTHTSQCVALTCLRQQRPGLWYRVP